MRTAPSAASLRAAISAVELRDLYVTRGLTIEKVGAHFGVAAATIRRRMRDLEVDVRPRGPVSSTRSARLGVQWNADVAYAVGIIATDGCLSGDGRHLTVVSKETSTYYGRFSGVSTSRRASCSATAVVGTVASGCSGRTAPSTGGCS